MRSSRLYLTKVCTIKWSLASLQKRQIMVDDSSLRKPNDDGDGDHRPNATGREKTTVMTLLIDFQLH
ncbi:hypothetical protein Hanom_Chr11g01041781 [Helianthus anomalus]